MPTMTPEFKAAWIAALRSGKYTQGHGVLRYTDDDESVEHCCLGVAAALIVGRETPLNPSHYDILPLSRADQNILISMNDDQRRSFDHIAGYLQAREDLGTEEAEEARAEKKRARAMREHGAAETRTFPWEHLKYAREVVQGRLNLDLEFGNDTKLSDAALDEIDNARAALSALPHPTPAAPPGYWLAPDELTQPMLNAAGFTAEDTSNRKRWAAFKKAAPYAPAADTVAVPREALRFYELERAAESIFRTFSRDEEQGFRSRDRQFAIELLKRFFNESPQPAAEITRLLGETS